MSTMVSDPRVTIEGSTPGALARIALRRLRQGELGAVPVVVGVVVIWITFYFLNENFITYRNINDLVDQIATQGGIISIGVVMILLLGEIDLAIAYTAAFTSAILVVLVENHGLVGPLGCAAAIAAGLLVGATIGLIRSWIGVPSFIVTLAANIALQGALLYTLGKNGTININDQFILDLDNKVLPVWFGWVLAIVVTGVVVAVGLLGRARRARAGLRLEPILFSSLRWGVIGAGALVVAYVTSQDRRVNKSALFPPVEGMQLGIVIFLAFLLVFHLILAKTKFGRDVFAVGGNDEAARRAGINVDRVRVTVFALASGLAAVGGIMLASHARNVNQSTGGSDLLLNVIAAAVIGGTSLFGGRGAVWTALLGWLVIGSISNGMDLLSLQQSVKFMITGGVLLAAVVVDALSRRGRAAAGRV